MHRGRIKHIVNARAWLTAGGAALVVLSIPVSFEWGVMLAFVSGVLGIALVLVGQTRPRQRGRHRWY